MRTFREKVLEIVKAIPKGSVMTYGEVAKRSGSTGAARAIGSIMAKNSDKNIPCHRVVHSDGNIGSYNGLRGKSKSELLKEEGVVFINDNKIKLV